MTSHMPSNKHSRILKSSAFVVPAITFTLLGISSAISLLDTAFSGQEGGLPTSRIPVTFSSQGQPRREEDLAKGKFLIAARHLMDPNFSKTVVLLIDYGTHGTLGLIINRPSPVRLSSVLPDIEALGKREDTVFMGGPVAINRFLMLVRTGSQPEESHHVFEDVYVSSSRAVLRRVLESEEAAGRFRVFAGHSGWAPGQLENEVSRGDWYILRADAQTVFDKAPSEIWPELIYRGTAQWVRVREMSNLVVGATKERKS